MATVRSNQDILAWCHAGMSGINPNVACHTLKINPCLTPVRRKRRPLDPVMAEAVKAEVDKLISIGFLRESLYPMWLTNPVLVLKPNGSWRMCIDFKNLNSSCLKD